MKSILKSVGYILFYMAFQMSIMSMISVGAGIASGSKEQMEVFMNNNMMVLTVISNILTIIVLILFIKFRKKSVSEEIQAKRVDSRNYVLPCVITFTYSMAFSLLTYNMSFENAKIVQTGVEYYSEVMPYLGVILQVIALLLVAPVTEEFICRGLILTKLQKEHGKVLSIVLSALLFAFLHVMAGGTVLVLGSLIVGLILGVICVRTNSLLPAIAAHIFANVPDFIIARLPELTVVSRYVLLVGFTLVFVGAIYIFMKKDYR
ncbi:MAG: CPBP family intramembrane metalloprotease [Eubacterium sp.]|nr:CPBP family intramembrane metalloprotease [Eubacterium sp.]